MASTLLQRDIFRLEDVLIGPGSVIPVGTELTRVRLETEDPDSVPPTAPVNDDSTLFTVGEEVVFRIDGTEVATTVPTFFVTTLQTEAGTFTGAVFEAQGESYFIPLINQDVTGAASVQASATVSATPAGTAGTANLGLLPVDADLFVGSVYIEFQIGPTPRPGRTFDAVLYDADDVRGNGNTDGEELVLADLRDAGTSNVQPLDFGFGLEIEADLLFEDGTVLEGVRGVRETDAVFLTSAPSYIFETATLEAAGQTIEDIERILDFEAAEHDLDWTELGFVLESEVPPPTNSAPVAVDDFYSVAEGGTLTVSVMEGLLANDGDPDGDALTVELTTGATRGELELNVDGSFTFTHDPDAPGFGFANFVSFGYAVTDGEFTDTGSVGIFITEPEAPAATADTFTGVGADDLFV